MLDCVLPLQHGLNGLRVIDFYVVLVTIALINCLSLSRITGPASWFAAARTPGIAILFTFCMITLLFATALFTAAVLTVASLTTEFVAAPWLILILNAGGAGLLLLPLSAWLHGRHTLASQRLRWLLPVAALEVTLLTTLLILAQSGPATSEAFLAVLLWSVLACAGIAVLMLTYAGLRVRLSVVDAPLAWRGLPLELVMIGVFALALLAALRALS